MVKYFEYRSTSGGTEETWLFYTAADQATDNVFLSVIGYRKTAEAKDGVRLVEEYWSDGGPIASTMTRDQVPALSSGDAAVKAMLADGFSRLAAGVN